MDTPSLLKSIADHLQSCSVWKEPEACSERMVVLLRTERELTLLLSLLHRQDPSVVAFEDGSSVLVALTKFSLKSAVVWHRLKGAQAWQPTPAHPFPLPEVMGVLKDLSGPAQQLRQELMKGGMRLTPATDRSNLEAMNAAGRLTDHCWRWRPAEGAPAAQALDALIEAGRPVVFTGNPTPSPVLFSSKRLHPKTPVFQRKEPVYSKNLAHYDEFSFHHAFFFNGSFDVPHLIPNPLGEGFVLHPTPAQALAETKAALAWFKKKEGWAWHEAAHENLARSVVEKASSSFNPQAETPLEFWLRIRDFLDGLPNGLGWKRRSYSFRTPLHDLLHQCPRLLTCVLLHPPSHGSLSSRSDSETGLVEAVLNRPFSLDENATENNLSSLQLPSLLQVFQDYPEEALPARFPSYWSGLVWHWGAPYPGAGEAETALLFESTWETHPHLWLGVSDQSHSLDAFFLLKRLLLSYGTSLAIPAFERLARLRSVHPEAFGEDVLAVMWLAQSLVAKAPAVLQEQLPELLAADVGQPVFSDRVVSLLSDFSLGNPAGDWCNHALPLFRQIHLNHKLASAPTLTRRARL